MICWLQEFFKNWAVAVEAGATLLLVIAAGFQWFAMRAQAKQERDRWKEEDKIRKEANMPRAKFWFEENGESYDLWCANLGTVAFVLGKIQIDCVPFKDGQKNVLISGQTTISIDHVVPVGEKCKHPIKKQEIRERLRRKDNGYNFEFTFLLEGPSGDPVRLSEPYFWMPGDFVRGFRGEVTVNCPTCNKVICPLSVENLGSKKEVEDLIHSVRSECAATCPEHISHNSRIRMPYTPPVLTDVPRYE
jgi:hypothetical protein